MTDQSMLHRYRPNSFLRLGRVSRTVIDLLVDCPGDLTFGFTMIVLWSESPKGGEISTGE